MALHAITQHLYIIRLERDTRIRAATHRITPTRCHRLPDRCCTIGSIPLKTSLLHVLLKQSGQPALELYSGLVLVLHFLTVTCHVVWQALVTNVTSPDVCCEHVLKRIFTVLSTVPLSQRALEPVQDTSKTVVSAAVMTDQLARVLIHLP